MEFNTKLVYTIVGALIAAHFIYKFIQRRLSTRNLPPKFRTFEPFLNFDWTFLTSLDATRYVKYQSQLGHTYRLPTIFTPLNAIVSCHSENVQVMAAGKDWGVGWRLNSMKEMLGVGLITTDGDEWMRARKMMRPAFNRNNIDDFEVIGRVADAVVERIKEGGEVDVQPLLADAFVNTSMQFILGLDSRQECDGRPMSVSKFGELWQQGLLGMGLRLLLGKESWILPVKQYERVCAKLHSFVDFAIGQAHERNTTGQVSNKKSMVDVLLAQTDDKDAQSQLMQTMLANQDTTSVLTCNMIQLLSERPDIWKQLREEVQTKGPAFLTYDALRDSKLIHNIQMEALRLRPLFPVLARRTLRPTTLPVGGGPDGTQSLPLPAGAIGFINFWSLNRNPDVFGPNVDNFNPDRWEKIKPKPKEFVPFGLGPRACLGKEKALAESAYLLVRLVRVFEGVEGRVGEWRPQATITMKNMAGYKVAFKLGEA